MEFPEWFHLEDDFEERSAIMEYEGGMNRHEAENLAAQNLGFKNKHALKHKIQVLKAKVKFEKNLKDIKKNDQ